MYETNSAIDTLLDPKSVALIGASSQGTQISGIILQLLKRFFHSGIVFPVNPKHHQLEGFDCYQNIAAIPEEYEIDAAIVSVPASSVVEVVEACGRRGVKGLVVIGAGFAEIGRAGATLQRELVDTARRYGLAVFGPNCAGLANFKSGFVAYGTTNFIKLESIKVGETAIVTASGGFGNILFTGCQERGIGLSHLIGLGNEAVTNSGDILFSLVHNDAVRIILMYLEGIRDPTTFFAAADAALERGKPIIVLKAGRSEAGHRAVATHTAAIAGSARALAGAFRQHGIIEVGDLDELIDMAVGFSDTRTTTAQNIGIFSLGGGGSSLMADLATEFGFGIPDISQNTSKQLGSLLPSIATPSNPLDTTAGFARDGDRHRKALSAFLEEPAFDLVVHFPVASEPTYSRQLANEVLEAKLGSSKSIVSIWPSGRVLDDVKTFLVTSGIPVFSSVRACFACLKRLRDYEVFRTTLMTRQDPDERVRNGQNFDFDGTTGESLLASYNIVVVPSRTAHSEQEAVRIAAELHAPVVLKVSSHDIDHKSEVGGVVLNVSGDDAIVQAYRSIVQNVSHARPGVHIDGVEIQAMLPAGYELLLGTTYDDQLGPTVCVGHGGVDAAIINDVQQCPAPLSRHDAAMMVTGLKHGTLFVALRERFPQVFERLIDTICSIGDMAYNLLPSRLEVDINPLIVAPHQESVIAVDYLIYVNGTRVV